MKKFNQYQLQQVEQNEVKAGAMASSCCGCSCYYANSGGSGTLDNGEANANGGLKSPIGQLQPFLPTVIVRPN